MRTLSVYSWIACLSLSFSVLPDPTPSPEAADEQLLKDNRVPLDGPGLIEFLHKRTLTAEDEAGIRTLVHQLGDDEFDRREDASRRLVELGARAKPFVVRALTDPDAEIVQRARECLRRIDQGAGSNVVAAAVRAVARLGPEGAPAALLSFLPADADEQLAEEIRLALTDLTVRAGKPEPVLTEALTDKSAVRRSVAAVALVKSKIADPLPAVRKLLDDPEPVVRFHTALALASVREKEAVPALIALLDKLPPAESYRVADYLYHLADDKGPPPLAETDAAARRKYRDTWKAWWDAEGEKLDAARLEDADKTLGFTLVVLLDKGVIQELDAANKPRFQLGELQFPLDVQSLPGDHVLVAEHNGNRVTERTSKNEVVWEKKVDAPIMAQRLPSGNTFIATRERVMEVKSNGEEVFSYQPPNGQLVMKAMRLKNGDVALITQLGGTRFLQVDAKGKASRDFAVQVKYSGGRIEVLPNGNVIVPESDNNRVAEFDAKGQVVWEAPVDQPIAAVRLANGNTLVTLMKEMRAVELDRHGKEVWQYKQDTRVTRAFRR
jgi:hypothetical protein